MDLKDQLGRQVPPSTGYRDPTVVPLMPLEAVHPIWFGDEARIGQKNKITRPLGASLSVRLALGRRALRCAA